MTLRAGVCLLTVLMSAMLVACDSFSSTNPLGGFSGRAPWVEAGGRILRNTSKELTSKYDLVPCASGGRLYDAIYLLELGFDTHSTLTIQEARTLIVASLEVLVRQMNSDEKARQYLVEFPATVSNAKIVISARGEVDEAEYLSYVSLVSNRGNLIVYRAVDPRTPYTMVTLKEETYQEALVELGKETP